MLVGVLSDTHGYLHPKVFTSFKGVNHILHAGDIGSEEVLIELRAVAPVTAVLGNGDYFSGYQKYSHIKLVEFDRVKILLTHQYPAYGKTQEELQERIRLFSPQIIISGHTHSPSNKQIDHTFYFNPGSAGNTLYHADKSVGLISIFSYSNSNAPSFIHPEIIRLEEFKTGEQERN